MARAATSPELALFRTPGQWSKLRAAIFAPTTVYSARINQTFSTLDRVLEITYDGGVGTLADALPGMTLLIGSSAGAHDIGIVRIRDRDATKFYINETSDVSFADNQYLTVIDDYGLWARPVFITAGVPYMDGSYAYTDQHTNFDPVPIMGGNRVLKLTGASVSAVFNGSPSYVLDSTISAYSWTAPGSSSSSGMTTATPTITWNTVGWKLVYLTVTAANGKSFFGVRYVYIWNEANPPPSAEIGDCRTDVESGGWQFDITLFDNADLTTIRDHALVILFAEDHYGDTEQSIGPVVGCENIMVTGWIAKETITWNPEQGQVQFTGYTAQYWFQRIPAWPDGVELVTGIPAAWTEVQALTVNKGLFHFLHWRTTATRVMDVFLTDNTLYTKEVSSMAQNLWEQLREMAFLQIFARAGVNALNQLYIEVHPQLVPEASRTWPTVMTITKEDWEGQIDFERVTINELSLLNLSGVSVNSSGASLSYFSLAPGHAHPRFGKPEIVDLLLLESQSQSNILAGMYYRWRNNPYPDIPIVLSANNRLIDCFPRQKCAIVIAEEDTLRGSTYSGNLIPTAVSLVPNPETGYVQTEVSFEAETGQTATIIAVNGGVPGSGDISVPPTPSFPPLPPFPIIIPGTTEFDETATMPAILHDITKGLLYTANINTANPQWITVNSGLIAAQYQNINTWAFTPSGGIYVACRANNGSGDVPFIAYAPSIGATFTVIEDSASILAKFPTTTVQFVNSIAVNPLNGQAVYVIGGNVASNIKAYIGSGTTFAAGATITGHNVSSAGHAGSLSYGFGKWLLTGQNSGGQAAYYVLNAAASSITASGTIAGGTSNIYHVRAGTTDKCLHITRTDGNIDVSTGNAAVFTTVGDGLTNFAGSFPDNMLACDPTGMYLMGRWSTQKGKSSDGGATWSALSSLPPGNWWFAYAGSTSWWLMAGGSSIRMTKDFGTTFLNREGNLLSVAPVPNIDMTKVVA